MAVGNRGPWGEYTSVTYLLVCFILFINGDTAKLYIIESLLYVVVVRVILESFEYYYKFSLGS